MQLEVCNMGSNLSRNWMQQKFLQVVCESKSKDGETSTESNEGEEERNCMKDLW